MKRSLILAGGGMRVAYQAGAIKALLDSGLTFHHIDGTSGGIMNAAMMLSGLNPDEMCRRWRTLKVKDFVSLLPIHEYIKGPAARAMGDADGVIEKVFPHLGIDCEAIRAQNAVRGTFNVCNYDDKTVEAIPHGEIATELLVAGMSLPIFMPMVQHNGRQYIDAVWIKDANLMEAVRRGSEEIWLVWIIGNTSSYQDGWFDQYVHMIEMSANGALNSELQQIAELNERISRGDSPYGQTSAIKLHIVKPHYALPLDPDYFFGKINADQLVSMGHLDASRYLNSKTSNGVALNKNSIKMNSETKPGMRFREMMKGPFEMGQNDPNSTSTDAPILELHASIQIDDMDSFVTDRAHSGGLVGRIEYPPLGENLLSSSGIFNLFSPSDSPDTKLMIYEMGFQASGQEYYFAGKKLVHDDPGFDLWSDTTTLFARIHKGSDSSGEVIAAGTIKISISQLIKMVSSMTATNPDGVMDKLAVKAKFGKLFLGELWTQYISHSYDEEDG